MSVGYFHSEIFKMPRKIEASTDDVRIMSFREQIFGKSAEKKDDSDIQRINVMTRVRSDVVEVLDALVELGAFNSRSDAVASYLEDAILSKPKLYDDLKTRAKKIARMRESAMDGAIEAFQEGRE
jgi:Arc/MetJ-type ribon-helix-helix transcriptional regulator